MTELEALRRVAEAARKWARWTDHRMADANFDFYSEVSSALEALDALPAPATGPEKVEVAVWRDNDDGEVVFCIPKTERDGPLQGWTRLGTTRLAVKKGEGA